MTPLEALSCIIYSLFALLYDLLPHLRFLYVAPLLSLLQSPAKEIRTLLGSDDFATTEANQE